MTKKSRAGKEFEELIARIERILAPKGAIIQSPDYIPDLITNSPREVDISIRLQDVNENRLITIECRDRTGQQDTTWIEQLVTKQKDIGLGELMQYHQVNSLNHQSKKQNITGLKFANLTRLLMLKSLKNGLLILQG